MKPLTYYVRKSDYHWFTSGTQFRPLPPIMQRAVNAPDVALAPSPVGKIVEPLESLVVLTDAELDLWRRS